MGERGLFVRVCSGGGRERETISPAPRQLGPHFLAEHEYMQYCTLTLAPARSFSLLLDAALTRCLQTRPGVFVLARPRDLKTSVSGSALSYLFYVLFFMCICIGDCGPALFSIKKKG